jgi:hypothetical protein
MSAPTLSDLLSLRFANDGSPFANLATPSAATQTLAFAWAGVPVVASISSAPVPAAVPVVFVVM